MHARFHKHDIIHTYIYIHTYIHTRSVITDAMKAERLSSERDFFKQRAEEVDSLRRQLEELRKAQALQTVQVRAIPTAWYTAFLLVEML